MVLIGTCFGLRWFTPTCEVPLCGHATLASAAVLFNCLGERIYTVHLPIPPFQLIFFSLLRLEALKTIFFCNQLQKLIEMAIFIHKPKLKVFGKTFLVLACRGLICLHKFVVDKSMSLCLRAVKCHEIRLSLVVDMSSCLQVFTEKCKALASVPRFLEVLKR